jgi:hypothetical protein
VSIWKREKFSTLKRMRLEPSAAAVLWFIMFKGGKVHGRQVELDAEAHLKAGTISRVIINHPEIFEIYGLHIRVKPEAFDKHLTMVE